ncbi:M56 family metallopeptidase [Chitinophaga solisilvae]|uniref:M56 family metallopeptidase n=1 Tax=Chitinophaga solisilvae TaxID=1233460 RepID=UPI00136B1924|nr:M56 family metallopeptidase [Chitinophaga solisilvae]
MIPAIFIYLLKANIALILFFLTYWLGLRRLTFYTLNRAFLLAGIAFASLYPLIPINSFMDKHESITGTVMPYIPDLSAWQAAAAPVFTVWTALVWLFWAGVSVMAIRFLLQLFSLWKIHRRSERSHVEGYQVRLLEEEVNPFSFFRNIYINPTLHKPEEVPSILHHEWVHVRQWHSADIILSELNQVFYWFNPGAWLMKTAVRENLEFITDRSLLRRGVDKTAYQYNLIKVSGIPYATAIANNFNFSHLKNRIMMMNKQRSSGYQLVRYLVFGVLVGAVVLSLNYSKAAVAPAHKVISADTVPPPPPPPPPPSNIPVPPPAPPKNVPTPPKPPKNVKAPQAPVERKADSRKNSLTITGNGPIVFRDGTPPATSPVYVIDGKVGSAGAAKTLDANNIVQVDVRKDDQSSNLVEKYGENARNGVVFIYTKNNDNKSNNVVEERPAAGGNLLKTRDGKPYEGLVLIDGKPSTTTELSALSPDRIASMEVLKGDHASIYGKAAEKGVIRIVLKGESNINNNKTGGAHTGKQPDKQ